MITWKGALMASLWITCVIATKCHDSELIDLTSLTPVSYPATDYSTSELSLIERISILSYVNTSPKRQYSILTYFDYLRDISRKLEMLTRHLQTAVNDDMHKRIVSFLTNSILQHVSIAVDCFDELRNHSIYHELKTFQDWRKSQYIRPLPLPTTVVNRKKRQVHSDTDDGKVRKRSIATQTIQGENDEQFGSKKWTDTEKFNSIKSSSKSRRDQPLITELPPARPEKQVIQNDASSIMKSITIISCFMWILIL